MFTSLTVSVFFTAVFVATGIWALYRLAVHGSGTDPDVDQATELAHLLMSLAMLATVWDWSGSPDSVTGIVQVVVFGLFSLWFLTGTLLRSLPSGLHLVSTTAMVWMVVAMPQLMGMARGSTITIVTVLFAGLLAAAAGLWARRAVTADVPVHVVPDESGTGGPGTGRTALRLPDRVAARPHVTARLDASCHALMNLGMGAMLVAML